MNEILDHATLKDKQRRLRNGFPETMGLRVHRAISWIGRAERCGGDDDARFVFLWIGFNAAYADENEFRGIPPEERPQERDAFRRFFGKLVALDREARIHAAIWDQFSGPIRVLMDNKYVFGPFWRHHNGIPGHEDWETRLESSRRGVRSVLQAEDSAGVLCRVFDRLYVLRNQIVHGGSTWNSRVNRSQVGDGARILAFLMPVFVDVMMDNPGEEWGRPFYPVVD